MAGHDKHGGRRWLCHLRTGVLMAVCLAAAPAPLRGQQFLPLAPNEADRYTGCMDLARTDPRAAHEEAIAWRNAGGREPALHCLAVALLGLGDHDQAAQNLDALAASVGETNPALRAALLGQTGNAWTIAGKPGLAYSAQSAALAITPDDVGLLIDRAVTLAGMASFWEALDDLNRALAIDPARTDALLYRAAAWRNLRSLDLAEEDVSRVLTAEPERLDALLERGRIHAARDDRPAARRDLLRVLDLAAEGPLREAARRALEALDVKTQ